MRTPVSLLAPDETERLATLRHYDFLSLPPEEVFRDLLALAAEVFAQPVSFLALVDEHEVHFPVVQGTPPMAPVPRVRALCSSAILDPGVVAYENLAAAPQTGADAPAIRAALGQGTCFYAAAPLRMPDGHTIGVLCLASPQPRPFAPAEGNVLAAIAEVVSLAIAVRHLCLSTPELGPEQWESASARLQERVQALRSELRELTSVCSPSASVPAFILEAVRQRLQQLRMLLED